MHYDFETRTWYTVEHVDEEPETKGRIYKKSTDVGSITIPKKVRGDLRRLPYPERYQHPLAGQFPCKSACGRFWLFVPQSYELPSTSSLPLFRLRCFFLLDDLQW